jgi:hypothetical protein
VASGFVEGFAKINGETSPCGQAEEHVRDGTTVDIHRTFWDKVVILHGLRRWWDRRGLIEGMRPDFDLASAVADSIALAPHDGMMQSLRTDYEAMSGMIFGEYP